MPGLTKHQLLAHTRAREWAPTWRPLAHLTRDGLEAFGFGVTVDRRVVPLIARMRRAGERAQPVPVLERDSRQLTLL